MAGSNAIMAAFASSSASLISSWVFVLWEPSINEFATSRMFVNTVFASSAFFARTIVRACNNVCSSAPHPDSAETAPSKLHTKQMDFMAVRADK
jgi:hypothetical protein